MVDRPHVSAFLGSGIQLHRSSNSFCPHPNVTNSKITVDCVAGGLFPNLPHALKRFSAGEACSAQ